MMKRKDQDPYEYSLKHTQERARERYGVELTRLEYDVLVVLARQACGNALAVINTEGDQVTLEMMLTTYALGVVVFDKKRDLITTVLPPGDFKIS